MVKVSEEGQRMGAEPRVGLVPLRETVLEPDALLATCRVADWVPLTEGAKVTYMVQLALTATVLQLLVWVKLLATTPLIVTLETVSGLAPVLLKVMGRGAEEEPVIVGGKLMSEVERAELGVLATPVAESGR
jgi:hypothetical protein